jgi:anti-sigma factor RsiW
MSILGWGKRGKSQAEGHARVCEGYEPLLQDYLDGELKGTNLEITEVHLRSCRKCAHAVAVARQGSALLSLMNLPVDDPGPFFTHRVMAAVRILANSENELSFWRPLELLAMRAAWTASILLVCVLAYGAATARHGSVQTAGMRAADVRGMYADPFADPSAQIARRDDFDIAIETHAEK